MDGKATSIVLDVTRQRGGAQPHATVLYDHSRWGNNGTFLGAGEPAWVQLPSGLWMLDFDGTNDYIDCGNNAVLNFTASDFTIEFWTNKDASVAANNYLLCRGLLNTDGYYCFIYGSRLYFHTNQAAAQQSTYTFDFAAFGVWNYLVVTRIGASAIIYLNGIDRTDVAGAHIDPASCARSIKIGRYDNASAWYPGLIGPVRIYNYALNQEQINHHYAAERTLFGV